MSNRACVISWCQAACHQLPWGHTDLCPCPSAKCVSSDLEQLRKIRRRSPHDDTEAFTVFLRSDVEAKLVVFLTNQDLKDKPMAAGVLISPPPTIISPRVWLSERLTFGEVKKLWPVRRTSGARWRESTKRVGLYYVNCGRWVQYILRESSLNICTFYKTCKTVHQFNLSQTFELCYLRVCWFFCMFAHVFIPADIFRNQQLLKEYKDFWGNTKVRTDACLCIFMSPLQLLNSITFTICVCQRVSNS